MKQHNFFSSNWIYLLWCTLYFIFTWLMFGATIESFGITFVIYAISMLVALSPLGEGILRLMHSVRTLDTKKEKEYLMPIFDEVYETAKEVCPNLRKIKLFIVDAMYVNAFALGWSTVAVTRGAVQTLSEDELKGVIAHEIGHITRGHTIALLLTVVGNGMFTLMMIISQIIMNIITIIISVASGNVFVRGMLMLSQSLSSAGYLLLMYMIQAILAINSRKNEFEADLFAYEIGYGENLVESLYLFHETTMNHKMTLLEKMRSSHPHLAKRIARLEELIDNETAEHEQLVENAV